MGTWGAGILDDDLAQDVYDAYVAAAGRGEAPGAITTSLRQTHAGELTDPARDAVFWLAVAHAQRDLGALDRAVLSRVEHIVATGVDREAWAEAGRGEAGRRKAVLTRFLTSLTRPGPRRSPARRPKAEAPAVDFEVGDCLAIELQDGRFAGAVVTRDKRGSTAPSHILTFVDATGPALPPSSAFDPPRWLVLAPEAYPGLAVKFEVYADGLPRHRARYRVLGRIALGQVPEPLVLRPATWATLWRQAGSALGRSEK